MEDALTVCDKSLCEVGNYFKDNCIEFYGPNCENPSTRLCTVTGKIFLFAHCSGNSFCKIPYDNISNLKYVDLSENYITVIEENDFERYSSVSILFLSNNNISKIQEYSFRKLSNLTHLSLNINQIKDIPTNAFKYNKLLTALELGTNPLIIPDKKSFLASESLTYLNISFCNLKTLCEETFMSLPNLSILNLNGNPLTTINENVFRPIHKLQTIYMNFIGYECLKAPYNETINYFSVNNITYEGPPVCTPDPIPVTTMQSTNSSRRLICDISILILLLFAHCNI
ncbi:hypothetical protein L9F63_005466 [Diploptera punctata]|uniref:Uncharacterized protein n=1 Tax=Diploptera punctata TaxID=6984 RepID=A0AAD7ZCS1_DIPPU|nr:hypothetical protein L9F63_005466 [Diploptera punctata]